MARPEGRGARRNGIPRLTYTGGRDGTLTEHRMFADTDCPGAWLHERMRRLASEVNACLANATLPKASASGNPTALAAGCRRDAGFAGTYRCTVPYLRVRRSPGLDGAEVAHYATGEVVELEGLWWKADGFVLGIYVGRSGNRNYVAVGRATGKPEDDDYLVRV